MERKFWWLMKTWLVLPCLLGLCCLLGGCCFGGVALYSPKQSSAQFSLGPRGEVRPGLTMTNLTEAQVLKLWGPPDSIRTNRAALTVWHYSGAWSWAGIIPMFIAPAPLVVPTGHDYVDLYFKDGSTVKAVRSVTVVSGAGMGPDGSRFHVIRKDPNDPHSFQRP